MEIAVAGPIFIQINIEVSIGQKYLYHTRWEQNIVEILYIYGARAIYLLFYDNQGTESEWREIYIGVAGPISNHQHITGYMG